jgi:hypothetical protein
VTWEKMVICKPGSEPSADIGWYLDLGPLRKCEKSMFLPFEAAQSILTQYNTPN